MRFADLDLRPELRRGIEDAGFIDCSPIQALALPHSLDGADVAGQAQTGTGKTACFLLTIFTRLLQSNKAAHPGRPRAIVMAPTRELAVQIASDAMVLGRHTGLEMVTVYGGVGYEPQLRALRAGVDIVIGTPGRIIDYLKRRELKLDAVECTVIDEADRMFDMGFIMDIRFILRRLPPVGERQTMLFSATLSFRVMELAYEFMNNAIELSVEPERIVLDTISEVLYHVGAHEKFQLLLGLLRWEIPLRTIVFCNRKIDAERVSRRLVENGIGADLLSGDLPQSKRLEVITDYKRGDIPVLVATDVASRGLHVDDVTHVINYDVPQDPEDYVHRIGRTARMGAQGRAITLACEEYVYQLPAVEHFIGHKIPVERATAELFARDLVPEPPRYGRGRPRDGHGGGHGGYDGRAGRDGRSGGRRGRR